MATTSWGFDKYLAPTQKNHHTNYVNTKSCLAVSISVAGSNCSIFAYLFFCAVQVGRFKGFELPPLHTLFSASSSTNPRTDIVQMKAISQASSCFHLAAIGVKVPCFRSTGAVLLSLDLLLYGSEEIALQIAFAC